MSLPDLIEIIPLEKPVKAEITVPGSKSITNRALILAALAEGETTLEGALWSEDTQVMVECLRRLGFLVTPDWNAGRIAVQRPPGNRLIPSDRADLWVANSGTSMRFLSPLYLGGVHLSHNALGDARDQAMIFRSIKAEVDALHPSA